MQNLAEELHVLRNESLQEAVADSQTQPLEALLDRCRQQKASDMMLLFRAVCAAGFMMNSDVFECLQGVLGHATDRFVSYAFALCPSSLYCGTNNL